MQPNNTCASGLGLISNYLVDLPIQTDLTLKEEKFAKILDKAVSNLTTLAAPNLCINNFSNSFEEEKDKNNKEDQDDTPTPLAKY